MTSQSSGRNSWQRVIIDAFQLLLWLPFVLSAFVHFLLIRWTVSSNEPHTDMTHCRYDSGCSGGRWDYSQSTMFSRSRGDNLSFSTVHTAQAQHLTLNPNYIINNNNNNNNNDNNNNNNNNNRFNLYSAFQGTQGHLTKWNKHIWKQSKQIINGA